jgi:hypothetical protein
LEVLTLLLTDDETGSHLAPSGDAHATAFPSVFALIAPMRRAVPKCAWQATRSVKTTAYWLPIVVPVASIFECISENYENEEDLPHAGWNSCFVFVAGWK